MKTVGVSSFVKRQTKDSRYGYFDGEWSDLVDIVFKNMCDLKQGYRDGVILVPVPVDGFYTSMCKIDSDSVFETKFIARQDGEEKIRQTSLKNGSKTPASFVDIVLYRWDVLEEDGDRSTDCEWEIISINASLVEDAPMHPMTMARNMLHKEGGTEAEYTGKQFAEALWFWREYMLYEGE